MVQECDDQGPEAVCQPLCSGLHIPVAPSWRQECEKDLLWMCIVNLKEKEQVIVYQWFAGLVYILNLL